ncbi:benzoate diol dehydrogenase BenD [Rosenbergiella australiborealis]|uniref:1,6-dihydroxycyclohexa-2,4-diene-1-carboxylate dehydrogenase n=1 Tax=Rosenbergiella australiborealis TaxID=1544696 RepID=A0ABS5T266_9GAMM|nr:benzoate diol dehydrogenase BenD [Rosenbergiella australiborealis]MBT0726443.1 1,6-dihydroxycyclohexa-2,4-diene-1-carboxylate dehydrogenase [Rosenbergiella australiborealis]
MTLRLIDKTIVITGAAQGIGKRVAERAFAQGATLFLLDRSPLVFDVAEQLCDGQRHSVGMLADLEQWSSTYHAFEKIVQQTERIDILINNVGGTIWAMPYAEYTEDQIEAEIRRSLFPCLWGCRAVLPTMIKQGSGAIVNVSSVATRGVHRVPYSAAKGGVNALTQSLAFEYAPYGIRVNATAPGGTEAPERKIPRHTDPSQPTEQQQAWYQRVIDQTCETSLMHRYGTLDEQAAAILFLASDEASYITGTVLPVAGGDLG